MIDPVPTPKPRAARKAVVPPAAQAPIALPPAKKVTRKAPARKSSASKSVVTEPVVDEDVAPNKAAAKQAAPKPAANKRAVAKPATSDKAAATPVAEKAAKKPSAKKAAVKKSAKANAIAQGVAAVEPAPPAEEAVPVRPARLARQRKAKQAAPVETVEVVVGTAQTPSPADGQAVVATSEPVQGAPVDAVPVSDVDTPAVDAAPEAQPEPASQLPTFSSVQLQADAWGQHLHWQVGQGCPPALQQQALALMDGDGALDPLNDQGLLTLHQAASDAGHDLRIDLPVWTAVAAGRDLRWRVHLLEQAYPEGAASAALQALWPAAAGRLAGFQWEGALFAACAGRSLLADDIGLAPAVQSMAAAALLVRHFGVQRVLIVCPDAGLVRWQGLLAAMPSLPHRLCGESAWRAEAAELAAWAPELVIVDDAAAWRAGEAPEGLRALEVRYAVVLMPEPALRPQALADWLAWLDPQRLGVARQFMRRHRDGHSGWVGLDRLRDTLAPVMLCRTRSRWMQPVPGRRDRLVWVPMDAPSRAAQQAALAPLRTVVARWREAGYVSDQDQLTVREGLAALRQVCAAQSPAKREALAAWGAGNGAADGVCAELPWPLSSLREPRQGQALPSAYLLSEGGLDEQRLWLRCIEPQADDWLCDPALFHQGPALARRMDVVGWLVDRWGDDPRAAALRDVHHYSA